MNERIRPTVSDKDEIPITRSVIDQLDEWIGRLAGGFLPAQKVPLEAGFRLELKEHSAAAVMVAKAVRMVSGIRAALLLADSAYVTESSCLLRIVSDLGMEIVAVAEGLLRGTATAAQQQFVESFFRPRARTLEEYQAQERDRYISREEFIKADLRSANDAGLDGEHVRNLRRFLNSGYDAYVHGAYETAMELYHGGRHEFMLRGHESTRSCCIQRVAVASKLHEVVLSCALIAKCLGDSKLHEEILAELKKLRESDEQDGSRCA